MTLKFHKIDSEIIIIIIIIIQLIEIIIVDLKWKTASLNAVALNEFVKPEI